MALVSIAAIRFCHKVHNGDIEIEAESLPTFLFDLDEAPILDPDNLEKGLLRGPLLLSVSDITAGRLSLTCLASATARSSQVQELETRRLLAELAVGTNHLHSYIIWRR